MNLEHVEAVAKILRDSAQLTEIEVRDNGAVLRLRRPAPADRPKSASTARPKTAAAEQTTSSKNTEPATVSYVPVNTHLVGVFRAARPASVVPGDTVKEKQVLGYIEAMRLMNDCVAPVAGRVQSVLVQDGQPVEYGQTLFELAP